MRILLVEDNPGDARLTQEALKESTFGCHVDHVLDGVEAMSFLSDKLQDDAAELPDLILLDLNLPRKSGREVLNDMRADQRLYVIPTVVLTTSDSSDDINDCYRLCANCYITKPVELDAYLDTVKTIQEFWGGISKVPIH